VGKKADCRCGGGVLLPVRHFRQEGISVMKEQIHLGIIGLGNRSYGLMGGPGLLQTCILPRREVRVAAVCDLYEDRCRNAAETIEKAGQPAPFQTQDYRELIARPDVDAVLVSASWETHIAAACASMKAGKYTAIEVGGAYSLDDCWRLVRTHEETGIECMLMENCCWGRDELMVLNMVRQGVFGEIVHCGGGYRHDLRAAVGLAREKRRPYRFRNYLGRNCENYPTHELGPIASILDLNHGNRMLTLVSVASKSAGLHEYLVREKGPDYDSSSMQFAQGDVVTTVIKCARGETITLTLDTTLPRPYSRGFHVQGTKGMYEEDNRSIFLDGKDNKFDGDWKPRWNSVEEYRADYEHPVWKKNLAEGVQGGHGGIDWLEFSAFFRAVRENLPAPIDVYDAASWMSVTALSEQSVAMGGMPQAIPDFTNGMWLNRAPWEP
jgi:predicted dehydrogenase